MGCCTSAEPRRAAAGPKRTLSGVSTGTAAHGKEVYAPKSFRCPNPWCLRFVPAGEYTDHREVCDRQRQLTCAKCGEQVAFKDFAAHLAACDVVQCPHCPEKVLKVLLPYCPNLIVCFKNLSLMKDPRGAAAAAALEDARDAATQAAVAIQRAVRWRAIRLKWEAMIFRIVWFRIDRWDERGLFKSSRGSGSAVAPSRRLSQILKNKKLDLHTPPKNSSILVYPDGGLASLRAGGDDGVPNEKADHVEALRALMDLQQVPYLYFQRVLEDAYRALTSQPNVLEVNLIQGERCIVVGDLHGQLQDLNRILDDRGLPSDKVYYVFNGDFVDRGCNSCEVLTLVLVLYLAYPDRVILNRGNHESVACTEQYGCRAEVTTKYSEYIYKLCCDVFNAMPLATVCNGQILIVHGGLPRDPGATIHDFNMIDRFQEIPVSPKTAPEQMFMDLMWSDPDPDPYESSMKEWEPNYIRDAGCKWRLPLTQKFCARNNITLVLRSHHPPHAGYERLHEGMVTTLFSASNYTGVDSNHGAVAILTLSPGSQTVSVLYDTWKIYEPLGREVDSPTWTGQLPYSDLSHNGPAPGSPASVLLKQSPSSRRVWDAGTDGGQSPPYSPVGPNGLPLLSRTLHKWMTCRGDVVRQLRERVYNNHHMLMSSFCEVDSTDKGTVWKSEWVEVMSALICADLPWYFLRRFLAELEPATGRIAFARFVCRFAVPLEDRLFGKWLPHIVKWLQVQCLKFYSSVETAFDHSDLLKTGTLHYTEFFDMVANKLGALLQKDLVLKLYLAFDPDGTGYVSKAQFVQFFAKYDEVGYISDVQNWVGYWGSDTRQYIMWDQWLLRRFRKYINNLPARTAFRLITREDSDRVTMEDLRFAISKMSLTGNFRQNIQEGHLNLEAQDFRKRVAYIGGAHETAAYVANLFGVSEEYITRNTVGARRSIGVWPLSDEQLAAFHDRLDFDRDGVVSYSDFHNAFFVQDSDVGREDAYAMSVRIAGRPRFGSQGHHTARQLFAPDQAPILDPAPTRKSAKAEHA
eukprot:TRINITY_DN2839_c0_g3_i1.p1 TRINITY_DN2839_c0_g3~~TRINITY_DN2839_c0_g3_i1.p1  ORF type:complete len:1028 (+),score=384.89 TRINITY_DN2839_c0_g3_i1:135-3218(+)